MTATDLKSSLGPFHCSEILHKHIGDYLHKGQNEPKVLDLDLFTMHVNGGVAGWDDVDEALTKGVSICFAKTRASNEYYAP